ncbi:hypothetical protein [Deinococcus sp. QL22]|uniref:hypothetical protein n=1 Tax=Deinococcus sp. QL22 TaxID=2939437 RepID=UPI002016F5EA|nr:hypothetical protein [Deinococcus sp. QL22]UQN08610.1 hypothetical protein M1R55_21005 [Deinococcus sp. QL22]
MADTFPVGLENGDLPTGQQRERIIQQNEANLGAAAPRGQQGNGDTAPQDGASTRAFRSAVPSFQWVRSMMNSRFWLSGRRAIEESFDPADHCRSLSAARAALSEFGGTNVFGLDECEDDQGENVDLVFPILREVCGEAACEGLESDGRRTLF